MLGKMQPDGGEEEGMNFTHTDIKALLLVSTQVFTTCVQAIHMFFVGCLPRSKSSEPENLEALCKILSSAMCITVENKPTYYMPVVNMV
jgi:hypothetical protein